MGCPPLHLHPHSFPHPYHVPTLIPNPNLIPIPAGNSNPVPVHISISIAITFPVPIPTPDPMLRGCPGCWYQCTFSIQLHLQESWGHHHHPMAHGDATVALCPPVPPHAPHNVLHGIFHLPHAGGCMGCWQRQPRVVSPTLPGWWDGPTWSSYRSQ